MTPENKTVRVAFQKREAVLEKIIRQMKDDNLHTGTVYRNLEQELNVLKAKLSVVRQRSAD